MQNLKWRSNITAEKIKPHRSSQKYAPRSYCDVQNSIRRIQYGGPKINLSGYREKFTTNVTKWALIWYFWFLRRQLLITTLKICKKFFALIWYFWFLRRQLLITTLKICETFLIRNFSLSNRLNILKVNIVYSKINIYQPSFFKIGTCYNIYKKGSIYQFKH